MRNKKSNEIRTPRLGAKVGERVMRGTEPVALVKSGETKPTLVFTTDNDDEIFMIDVCSPAYCNPYGIYAGMPFPEFIEKVQDISESYGFELPFISINDSEADFVVIYARMDEDFCYKVDKSEYIGDGQFADGAKIARVCVMNAVG